MAAVAGIVLAGLLALAAAEITVRLLRFGHFPLFRIGGPERYRMAANQGGKLRGQATWRYDQHGMRSDGDRTSLAGAAILLGDSVVDGGNLASQDDTLAVQFGAIAGIPAYPVACHGWALANALEALQSLPGWKQAKWLICLVNAGDLDDFATAANPLSFPTRPPRLLVPWLLRRYLHRRRPRWWPWRTPPHTFKADPQFRGSLIARFAQLTSGFRGQVLIVYMPMRPEVLDEAEFCRTLAAAAPGAGMVNAGQSAGWGPDCYADHIHPSSRGRAKLARLIASQVLASEPRRAR